MAILTWPRKRVDTTNNWNGTRYVTIRHCGRL